MITERRAMTVSTIMAIRAHEVYNQTIPINPIEVMRGLIKLLKEVMRNALGRTITITQETLLILVEIKESELSSPKERPLNPTDRNKGLIKRLKEAVHSVLGRTEVRPIHKHVVIKKFVHKGAPRPNVETIHRMGGDVALTISIPRLVF